MAERRLGSPPSLGSVHAFGTHTHAAYVQRGTTELNPLVGGDGALVYETWHDTYCTQGVWERLNSLDTTHGEAAMKLRVEQGLHMYGQDMDTTLDWISGVDVVYWQVLSGEFAGDVAFSHNGARYVQSVRNSDALRRMVETTRIGYIAE